MIWRDPSKSHSQFKHDHRCSALTQLWAEAAKRNRVGFSFNHPLSMCPHLHLGQDLGGLVLSCKRKWVPFFESNVQWFKTTVK